MKGKRVWFGADSTLASSEIEALYHVLNAMRASDDPDEILTAAAASLQSDTGAEIVAILRMQDGGSSNLELVKALDVAGPPRYLSKIISGTLEPDWRFVPAMIADFQPRTFDFAAFEDHPTIRYLVEECGIKGALCAPIALDGAMIGFYALLSDRAVEIDETQGPFFVMLGGALAAVLEYCDLLERFEDLSLRVPSPAASEALCRHSEAIRDILRSLARCPDSSSAGKRPVTSGKRNQLEPFAALTQEELSTLALVSVGFSNEEIAQRLFISEGTVKKRIGSIMMKLGLKNRTQLGVYYARFIR